MDGETRTGSRAVSAPEKATAAQWRTYDLETAILSDVEKRCRDPRAEAPYLGVTSNVLAAGVGVLVTTVLGAARLLQMLDRRFGLWR